MADEQSRMIGVAAVLAETGMSRRTIERWVRDGRFPRPYKLGGSTLRWRRADVEWWIEAQAVDAA